MTIYHMRDLASGKRRIINCEKVKVYQVPYYEGLSIADMLQFAYAYPDVADCLPLEPREVQKLPRQYISSVIYTMVGDPFAHWVEAQCKARNDKVAAERDMLITLDPEIAKIFTSSTSLSGKCQL